jgi:L-fuconolactonase
MEAEYVIGLCERPASRMVGAVIGGKPASPDFAAYAERFHGSRWVKGVRQVLHGGIEKGYCLRKEFVNGIRELGSLGLRFDLCLRPDELMDGAALADLCPHTRFVLDHCGNGDVQSGDRAPWSKGIAEVAKRPNVVCKISGIVASARPGAWRPEDLTPFVERCAEAFGTDRVMFGSDWPVCTLAATYKQWVEALQFITRAWSETERRKLFHDNAVRFYGLN